MIVQGDTEVRQAIESIQERESQVSVEALAYYALFTTENFSQDKPCR